jgi:hydrogenase nickel incorporation protein HypA/HybF
MHELSITGRILSIVLQHAAEHEVKRIVRIHLRIGELSDLEDEWIQRYFDHISRGTLAEQAQLAITRAPIVVACSACAASFVITRNELGRTDCRECGEPGLTLQSGREYVIENMEVL